MLSFIRYACERIAKMWRDYAQGTAGPDTSGRHEFVRGHGREDRHGGSRRYSEQGARKAQERLGWGEGTVGKAWDGGAPRYRQESGGGEVEVMARKHVRPIEIAKWFVNRVDRDAGDIISHLKLQKLIYYAQAWYLANFGEELFSEDIQAWAHGPVVPSVWGAYKQHGWDAIPKGSDPRLDSHTAEFLEGVYHAYGDIGAKALENITHREDPWKDARGDLPPESRCTRAIRKELMRDFYGKQIDKFYRPGPRSMPTAS